MVNILGKKVRKLMFKCKKYIIYSGTIHATGINISDIQAYKTHNILKAKDYTTASNKLIRCCGIKIHKNKK